MKQLSIFVLILLTLSAYSQKQPKTKYGKISKEELKRTVCPTDSNAVAEVLFDVGNSYFTTVSQEGFKMNYERHFRIKIYKKEGYKYANFSIPLYIGVSNTEHISSIKGKCYNLENGKIITTKLKNSDVHHVKVHARREDARFTFPAVKEGCIIEGKYSILSDAYLNIRDWTFQKSIPVRYSKYVVVTPEYFKYRYNVRNFDLVKVQKKEENRTEKFFLYYKSHPGQGGQITENTYEITSNSNSATWEAFDVPAFKEEEYISSRKNYLAAVDYTLNYIRYPNGKIYEFNTSWEKIDRNLQKSYTFGKKIVPTKFIKNKVKEIVNENDDKLLKTKKIYNFITKNVRWNNLYALEEYNDQSYKQILDKGKGSVNDINMMLISMLKAAGIHACPVLSSTRDNGRIYISFPAASQFNFILAKADIDGKIYYLDATEPLYPFDILPKKDLNGTVRTLCGKGTFEEIKVLGKDSYSKMYLCNISDKGEIIGTFNENLWQYAAYDYRKAVEDAGGKDKFIDDIKTINSDLKITEIELNNLNDLEKPITIKSKVSTKSNKYIQKAGNMIYITPLLNNRIEENPFKLQDRKYPIDYAYPISHITVMQYTIPEGYEVSELPKSTNLSLPEKAAKYTFLCKVNASSIQIVSRFNVNKTLFLYSNYPTLKNFYDLVIKKQAEKIVLKKK